MLGVNVTVRQDKFSIRIHLQTFVDEENVRVYSRSPVGNPLVVSFLLYCLGELPIR